MGMLVRERYIGNMYTYSQELSSPREQIYNVLDWTLSKKTE